MGSVSDDVAKIFPNFRAEPERICDLCGLCLCVDTRMVTVYGCAVCACFRQMTVWITACELLQRQERPLDRHQLIHYPSGVLHPCYYVSL